jgi:hypothetical protein
LILTFDNDPLLPPQNASVAFYYPQLKYLDRAIDVQMVARDDEAAVVAEGNGIKIKMEKMITDKLYHCIYDNKVFLFYKDDQSLLHCYEVEHPDAVREIAEKPSELQGILKKYALITQG